MKKTNIIIDTDPGVDDATAITIALFSPALDIKLITTTAGNASIETTTRNTLFLLEKFGKSIPVCKGASKPLVRDAKNALSVHGKDGLGAFKPSNPKTKPISEAVAEKMFEVIKQNAGNITIVELGPQTNLGHLFLKHPEAENMISKIIFEGGSPYGKANVSPHISFNISFDPESADIVMKTKIPKVIVPSEIGRYLAYFSSEQIETIKNTNSTGAFLAKMFEGYHSKYIKDATETNDLSAVMFTLYPEIFSTYNCNIKIDLDTMPGKTTITENPDGNVTFVESVDRLAFFEKFIKNLKGIEI
ncbi:MAG: nucleoside hydrolase [Christensenellales bacterium]